MCLLILLAILFLLIFYPTPYIVSNFRVAAQRLFCVNAFCYLVATQARRGTLLDSRLICLPVHHSIVASNNPCFSSACKSNFHCQKASGCVYLLATAAGLIVTPIVKPDGANIKEKVPLSFGSKMVAVQEVHIWCLFAAFLWLNPLQSQLHICNQSQFMQ